MKRFATALQEGKAKKSLLVSYKTIKFVLRNFKVNADYIPSYEGFLITFNTLRSLSRKHSGGWPSGSDLTTVANNLKLFRYYSHHFSYNYFKELPATVPSLLLLLMLSEERYNNCDLFSYFSHNSPNLEVSFDNPLFFALYSRIKPFYLKPNMKNQKTPKFSRNPCEERGFFIFLHELITLESGIIPPLEVEDGSTVTLNLDEREKWLIKVFLKLHGRKHFHNLYLTE